MGSKSRTSERSKRKRSDISDEPKDGVESEPPRKLRFPAAASAALPSASVVSALEAEFQDEFVAKTALLCERAILSIDSGVGALQTGPDRSSPDEAATVEDAILADMARLRGVSLAKEYVDIALWRGMRNANSKVIEAVEEVCSGSAGQETGGADAGDVRSAGKGKSFKQVHMDTITNDFASDLEKIHETEEMDGERVLFLLRCLEEGADLFSHLRI